MALTEYVGVPVVGVFVQRKSQQYIGPNPDFDFDMSSFYKKAGSPNIENKNVFFLEDIGVAMVAPLFTERSNYVEGGIKPVGGYVTEHPGWNRTESETEICRRVFIPSPTLHQYISGNTNNFVPFGTTFPPDYTGPIFDNLLLPPPKGCKQNVSWIYQRSASDDVEWFLYQKEPNFQNQSFWIDIHKDKTVKLDNTDDDTVYTNRYFRYGRELRAYIAVRLGWDTEKPRDYSNPRNKGGHRGPYDVVFPIGGTPFLWDHGASIQDGEEDNGNQGTMTKFDKAGFVASEQANWVLNDDINYFRLMFFIVKGQLVIKTSFSENSWIFPQNLTGSMTQATQEAYKNFYVPEGRVCIMGRGFKFRMSFNPLEFDIYNHGVEKAKPHARLTTSPVQERDDYPSDSFNVGKNGWLDLHTYKEGEERQRGGSFNNFFVIPDASNSYDNHGDHMKCSYGMDVNDSGTHTSMMIPVDGTNPHSSSFNPDSATAVAWTKLRGPAQRERIASFTPVTTGVDYDYNLKKTQGVFSFRNQVIDIGLTCLKPDVKETSHRFASPVIWRLKGKNSIPKPVESVPVNIAPLIKNISYSTTAADLETVRQEFTIDVLIPQSYQTEMFPYGSNRTTLLNLLQNGSCEIQIFVGWTGGNFTDPAIYTNVDDWGEYEETGNRMDLRTWNGAVLVFTGITSAGGFNQAYGEDVLQIKCFDKIKIIEDYKFLNSPFYDGMNVDDAFFHIGTLSGLPKTLFRCDSIRAATNVLGSGYTFTEPKFKFSEQESLFDGIKRIASQFWHVVRTDADGTIVLTDLNASSTSAIDGDDRMMVLEEISISHPSYVFYVDGSQTHNPFQRMYGKFTLTKDNMQAVTNIEIYSVDKYDGALIIDNTAYNIDSIENPSSPNFIGYRKPMRITNPALGSREKISELRNKLSKHVFEPQYTISFTTYGRPSLKPFDIIKVVFPTGSAYASYFTNLNGSPTNWMHFRVMGVSGQIDVSNNMLHTMTVSATHM